ncbi:MAG: outer membrane beta-barrel protein, partial [Bacteroidota bacterium]
IYWEVNDILTVDMKDVDITDQNGIPMAKYSKIDISLGEGFNAGISFGHHFTDHLSGELGVSYLFGATAQARTTATGLNITQNMSATMLQFNPSVVIDAGDGSWTPYARLGFIAGFGKITYEVEGIDDDGKDSYTMILDDDIAAGWTAGLGIRHSLNDKISIFGELSGVAMNYAPGKAEVTEYTSNGVDQLNQLTVNERKVEFFDDFDYPLIISQPADEPYTALKKKLPFGSFGLRFGARINL